MTKKEELFRSLMEEIGAKLGDHSGNEAILGEICELLTRRVPYYDWVGFYLVDKESGRQLILGPFVGEPTEHTSIPFGQGICGQAAEREGTFVVQDVTKENNYLSCSIDVRSEIVVPIFRDGKVVGEIDIDSHTTAPFSKEDRVFLEKLAEMVSAHLILASS